MLPLEGPDKVYRCGDLRKEKGRQLLVFARRDEVDWDVRHDLAFEQGTSVKLLSYVTVPDHGSRNFLMSVPEGSAYSGLEIRGKEIVVHDHGHFLAILFPLVLTICKTSQKDIVSQMDAVRAKSSRYTE